MMCLTLWANLATIPRTDQEKMCSLIDHDIITKTLLYGAFVESEKLSDKKLKQLCEKV